MRLSLYAFGLSTLVAASPLSIRQHNSTTNDSASSFADVPMTKELQWKPCYGGNFTCSNLEVPLDYDHPEVGSTNVAFLRYEAATQPALGDLIINPGGPGGSGVATLLNTRRWTALLGDKYNLIGMDPRGVNNSSPITDPLSAMPATRNEYITEMGFEYDSKSPAAIKQTFVHAGAYGDFASQKLSQDVKYINTPAVAYDMLHYIELAAASRGEDSRTAKLNFFGVSYGSILGTTFAQLFPDRVGKMVIDGVMDPADYYDGAWTKSISQADEAVRAFATHCFSAGPNCPFYANDTDPGSVLNRLDTVLHALEKEPVGVWDPYFFDFPAAVNHMDLRNMLMWSTYDSYSRFPVLALILAELESGNATTLAQLSYKGLRHPAECDGPVSAYEITLSKFVPACNDMDGRYNISSVEMYQEYIGKMEDVSSYIGAAWAKVMTLYCRKLDFSPPASQKLSGRVAYKEVNTSNPLLFVSNTVDPVTSSLEEMIEFFPGAGKFYQNAVGHGVLIASSECMSEHTRRYLETGELPPADVVCQPDGKVFDIPEVAAKA
ncbi:hypothetical protein SVAN01_03672 [Stagonosporopsis vannaccii]|nr:hypothetical protein SVAN01_03672 [Stagonosporopsis vannaccii]